MRWAYTTPAGQLVVTPYTSGQVGPAGELALGFSPHVLAYVAAGQWTDAQFTDDVEAPRRWVARGRRR